MPLRRVAVADTAVVVAMVREAAVAIMAVIMREVAANVVVMSAARISAVGATSLDDRRAVRLRSRVSTAIVLSLFRP